MTGPLRHTSMSSSATTRTPASPRGGWHRCMRRRQRSGIIPGCSAVGGQSGLILCGPFLRTTVLLRPSVLLWRNHPFLPLMWEVVSLRDGTAVRLLDNRVVGGDGFERWRPPPPSPPAPSFLGPLAWQNLPLPACEAQCWPAASHFIFFFCRMSTVTNNFFYVNGMFMVEFFSDFFSLIPCFM